MSRFLSHNSVNSKKRKFEDYSFSSSSFEESNFSSRFFEDNEFSGNNTAFSLEDNREVFSKKMQMFQGIDSCENNESFNNTWDLTSLENYNLDLDDINNFSLKSDVIEVKQEDFEAIVPQTFQFQSSQTSQFEHMPQSLNIPHSPQASFLPESHQQVYHPSQFQCLQQAIVPLTTTQPENTMVVRLQLSSTFEKLWYSGRPFPAFSIEVVDSVTGNRINANGWKLLVSVFDGNNTPADEKMCDKTHSHLYEIYNGTVTISGLRFLSVSSKAGGHFTLSAKLAISSSPSVTHSSIPFVSERIQILSYRLFLIPKAENEALTPEDQISKMKGIGNLTSKRFAEIGIKSISQLASVDPEYLGIDGFNELLNHLRKNRGSLTKTKLLEYIKMAREVVDRSGQCDTNNSFGPISEENCFSSSSSSCGENSPFHSDNNSTFVTISSPAPSPKRICSPLTIELLQHFEFF
jgi:hypothetical protein